MPYIEARRRPHLDENIDKLAEAIVDSISMTEGDMAVAGLMNYSITRLVMQVVNRQFGGVRYAALALVTGVLVNVKDELYRRVAAPYEDLQVCKSGDVPEYAAHERKMDDEALKLQGINPEVVDKHRCSTFEG